MKSELFEELSGAVNPRPEKLSEVLFALNPNYNIDKDHLNLYGVMAENLEKQNAELLEALKEVNRYFYKMGNKGKWAKRLYEANEQAIKKAEYENEI